MTFTTASLITTPIEHRSLYPTESNLLMRCFMMAKEHRNNPDEARAFHDTLTADFAMFKIMAPRAEAYFPVSVQTAALLWLTLISNTPGKVLVLMALAHAKSGGRELTLETLARQTFPDGVPTERELSRLWALQKNKADGNMLDNIAAWDGTGVEN